MTRPAQHSPAWWDQKKPRPMAEIVRDFHNKPPNQSPHIQRYLESKLPTLAEAEALDREIERVWHGRKKYRPQAKSKTIRGSDRLTPLMIVHILQRLADLAAQSSENLAMLPKAQQGDFARALLENTLEIHRNYAGLGKGKNDRS